MKYRIELVWNREFNWSPYGKPTDDLKDAILTARSILYSGDGTRVKKIHIVENDTGKVVWNG